MCAPPDRTPSAKTHAGVDGKSWIGARVRGIIGP
jgi:hypothetical protein